MSAVLSRPPASRPPPLLRSGGLPPAAGAPRAEELAQLHAGAWFAGLSEPLRGAIVERSRLRQVAAGTTLARRGDPACDWVGVAHGAIRLSTTLRDGRCFTLDFVGPGQWYGDIALFDEKPQDLDVVAHAPTTLLLLPKPELRWLNQESAELRDAFMQLNCQRLRHMFRRFEDLHALPLGERLARQLLRLAQQFGRGTAKGVAIDLVVSQGDLAALVGCSRQRANRAWRQLDKRGIVQLNGNRIAVLDEAQLRAVAEGRLELEGVRD